MRLIQQHKDKPEIFEVAWMWLPTFIGQNTALLGELDHALSVRFPPPLEVNDEVLDKIHDFIVKWICDRHRIDGLEGYLRAIEDVGEDVPGIQKNLFRELRQLVRALDMKEVATIEIEGKVSGQTDLEVGPFRVTAHSKES